MFEGYEFDFDAAKNILLKEMRGISFDEVVALIESGRYVDVKDHHNTPRYPRQKMLEIEIKGYIYCIPCVIEEKKVFLKTIYPSRKATRKRKGKSS